MNRPNNIEKEAQLLKGIGSSSWFYIVTENQKYRIKRYSEEGIEECSRLFSVNNSEFNVNKEFKFTYISNCKQCKILQNNIIYVFTTENYGD